MHSEVLLQHFQNPRNVGELPGPALTVEVSNPACGDTLRLSARFEEGRVAEIRYKVLGCTASIAAGSVLTERLLGQPAMALGSLRSAEIDAALGGLIPESRHAAVLCIDGARALLRKYEEKA